MQSLFRKQNKLIPVTFADGVELMFSDNDWERDFMVHMWELLKLYSVEDLDSPKTDMMEVPGMPDGCFVFDPSSDYPLRYTNRGGPVPIQIASGLVHHTGLVAAKSYCEKEEEYKWTVDQYRYAILSLRVVIIPTSLSSSSLMCRWRCNHNFMMDTDSRRIPESLITRIVVLYEKWSLVLNYSHLCSPRTTTWDLLTMSTRIKSTAVTATFLLS
jgi:hypothetical protein